jgi:hypothetical protein
VIVSRRELLKLKLVGLLVNTFVVNPNKQATSIILLIKYGSKQLKQLNNNNEYPNNNNQSTKAIKL